MAFKLDQLRRDMERRRAMSPENRGDLDAREEFVRIVPMVMRDERMREEMSKEVRVLNLATFPETRADRDGTIRTGLYHAPKGEEPVYDDLKGNVGRAYVLDSEAERLSRTGRNSDDPKEDLFRRLDRGSTVTVLGEEVSVRRKNGRTGQWFSSKEFQVVKVAEGVHDMETMKAVRRSGPAEKLVEAVVAYDRAETQAEKEAIVRAHLGQPEKDRPSAGMPSSKGPDRDGDDEIDAILADMVKDIGGKGR